MTTIKNNCSLCDQNDVLLKYDNISEQIQQSFFNVNKNLFPKDYVNNLHLCITCAHKIELASEIAREYNEMCNRNYRVSDKKCFFCEDSWNHLISFKQNPNKILEKIVIFVNAMNVKRDYKDLKACVRCLYKLDVWAELRMRLYTKTHISTPDVVTNAKEKGTSESPAAKTSSVAIVRRSRRGTTQTQALIQHEHISTPDVVTNANEEGTSNSPAAKTSSVAIVRRSRRGTPQTQVLIQHESISSTSQEKPEDVANNNIDKQGNASAVTTTPRTIRKRINNSDKESKWANYLKDKLKNIRTADELVQKENLTLNIRNTVSDKSKLFNSKPFVEIVVSSQITKDHISQEDDTSSVIILSDREEQMTPKIKKPFKRLNLSLRKPGPLSKTKNKSKKLKFKSPMQLRHLRDKKVAASSKHRSIITSAYDSEMSVEEISSDDKEDENWTCNVCDKIFTVKCDYLAHTLKHEKTENLVVKVSRSPLPQQLNVAELSPGKPLRKAFGSPKIISRLLNKWIGERAAKLYEDIDNNDESKIVEREEEKQVENQTGIKNGIVQEAMAIDSVVGEKGEVEEPQTLGDQEMQEDGKSTEKDNKTGDEDHDKLEESNEGEEIGDSGENKMKSNGPVSEKGIKKSIGVEEISDSAKNNKKSSDPVSEEEIKKSIGVEEISDSAKNNKKSSDPVSEEEIKKSLGVEQISDSGKNKMKSSDPVSEKEIKKSLGVEEISDSSQNNIERTNPVSHNDDIGEAVITNIKEGVVKTCQDKNDDGIEQKKSTRESANEVNDTIKEKERKSCNNDDVDKEVKTNGKEGVDETSKDENDDGVEEMKSTRESAEEVTDTVKEKEIKSLNKNSLKETKSVDPEEADSAESTKNGGQPSLNDLPEGDDNVVVREKSSSNIVSEEESSHEDCVILKEQSSSTAVPKEKSSHENPVIIEEQSSSSVVPEKQKEAVINEDQSCLGDEPEGQSSRAVVNEDQSNSSIIHEDESSSDSTVVIVDEEPPTKSGEVDESEMGEIEALRAETPDAGGNDDSFKSATDQDGIVETIEIDEDDGESTDNDRKIHDPPQIEEFTSSDSGSSSVMTRQDLLNILEIDADIETVKCNDETTSEKKRKRSNLEHSIDDLTPKKKKVRFAEEAEVFSSDNIGVQLEKLIADEQVQQISDDEDVVETCVKEKTKGASENEN